MALNIAVFKTRALSALIFVAVMLLGLLWNFWSFFILFSVIHFGCWIEYQRIIGLIDQRYASISNIHRYGVMILGWCIMLYSVADKYLPGGILLHQTGYWLGMGLLLLLLLMELIFVKKVNLQILGYSLLGLLYISLGWGLLTYLYSKFNFDFFGVFKYFGFTINIGKFIVLMIIVSIWINDTMAYIIGSLIGKTPLTKISPKKTWEGTLGGILLSVVVMGIIGYFNDREFSWSNIVVFMIFGAVASIAGTFGDILESKLKRMANLKDSGQILPGHGGFLDRFDSMLVATPFIWFYVVFVLN